MDFWLGIDCGGTFIKAGIYDEKGKEYGSFRHNLEVISRKPGWAERDPEALWQGCAAVIRGVLDRTRIDPNLIRGAGISAQGKGLFVLDKQGNTLGCGILSSDQRSLAIVKRWQQENIPERLYPITRQTLWTGHPVSILRWLKENDNARYQRIGAVLMSHDYLRFRLTGNVNCEETNISESNLYNMTLGGYDPKLTALLKISEIDTALPPIVGASEIAGYITPQAAEQTGLCVGTPVVGGLFDVVSTALCAGLDDETKLNAVLGTWSVVSGITDHIDLNQSHHFVYGKYAQEGKFIVHEASPTSAANLEWFVKQWGMSDYEEINGLVAALPKADSSIFFLPFLYGSNAGLGMQAGFYGIQSLHGKAHLLQAVFEGVMFSLMTHLERMLIRFPQTKVLRVTGGPAKSKVWLQMLADLSGLVIEVPQIEETGCYGAALMAMVGNGVNRSVLSSAIGTDLFTIQPDSKVYEKYRQKYARYKKLVGHLQAFNQESMA